MKSLMHVLILLASLLVICYSDSKVTIYCAPCSTRSGICFTFYGGPFDRREHHNSNYLTCPSIYPATYTFRCRSSCTYGCLVHLMEGNVESNYCSNTIKGTSVINNLNSMFKGIQLAQGRRYYNYNWCACKGYIP